MELVESKPIVRIQSDGIIERYDTSSLLREVKCPICKGVGRIQAGPEGGANVVKAHRGRGGVGW